MKKSYKITAAIALVLLVSSGGAFSYSYYKEKHDKGGAAASINKNIDLKAADQKNNNLKSSNVSAPESEAQKKADELEKEYNTGYTAYSNRQYEKAIKIENDVISKDANFYKAYNVKGIAICFSGDFNSGMDNIDKALSIKPDFAYGRFNKALAYELYRKFDSALEWYNKALEVQKYEWSYYGIASIYGRRGDVDNTVKYLKIAIDMKPAIKDTAKEESDFNPVKNSKKFKELVYN